MERAHAQLMVFMTVKGDQKNLLIFRHAYVNMQYLLRTYALPSHVLREKTSTYMYVLIEISMEVSDKKQKLLITANDQYTHTVQPGPQYDAALRNRGHVFN